MVGLWYAAAAGWQLLPGLARLLDGCQLAAYLLGVMCCVPMPPREATLTGVSGNEMVRKGLCCNIWIFQPFFGGQGVL